MTLVHFGVLLAGVIFFIITTVGVVVPLWQKKSKDLLLISLSWGISIAFLASIALTQIISFFLPIPPIMPEFQYVALLTGVGVIIMPKLFGYPLKWQCSVIYLLCFLGTLVFPETLFGVSSTWGVIGIKLLIAALWTGLILTFVELDRVPVEGFVLTTAYFLLLLFMATGMLGILPDDLFGSFMQILSFVLLTLVIYKKNSFVWLGFPMMFALMFIAGFFLCRLAVTPAGGFVLIMLSYPLVEAILAIGLNLYRNHRIFPITIPLMAERGIIAGIPVKTVVLRIFYIILLTGIIGVLGLRTSMRYFPISIFMAALVMYGTYIRLTRNTAKVSLRSITKDAKMGMSTLWQEVKTLPLKEVVEIKQSKSVPPENKANPIPTDKPNVNKKQNKNTSTKNKTKHSVSKTKSTRAVQRMK